MKIVPVPDELIMAIADGEPVDPPAAARAHKAIESDDEARRKHDIFVATRALLAGAYDGILEEPVPERLIAAITKR